MLKSLVMLMMALIGSAASLFGQPNFRIEIEEQNWPQAPAIHSFACGVSDGKWVFIGGRTNGLHGFLPPLAFPNSGRNTDITLFDPVTGQRWDQPINVLPDSIREPLLTSNMQFHQTDSMLYIVGGYGWNANLTTFITYPKLTAVNVNALTRAILNSEPILPHFRQITDSALAICGSHLAKIDSTYHLVFGHRFDGIYDRQDTTGFHIQRYSHADRRFRILDNGHSLQVQWLPEVLDSLHFRRRDYNLVPQIFPNRNFGYTAFSGVFQKGINLPYLYPIDVHNDSILPRTNFEQQLANYHSAVLPLYDSAMNNMHTVFFGGESSYYYDSTGTLVMDSLVPFVNTISVVTRQANGYMQEFVADTSMPGLLGSNAQFFPVMDSAWIDLHGIVRLDQLAGRTLVGYVMGGIESPLPNISDSDPSLSWATNRVFAIYIHPNATAIHQTAALPPFGVNIFPNPFHHHLNVRIKSEEQLDLQVELLNMFGQKIETLYEGPCSHQVNLKTHPKVADGVYFIKVKSGEYAKVYRVVHVGK